MTGKLCRSLFPYVNTAKWEDREWKFRHWVTQTYLPRFVRPCMCLASAAPSISHSITVREWRMWNHEIDSHVSLKLHSWCPTEDSLTKKTTTLSPIILYSVYHLRDSFSSVIWVTCQGLEDVAVGAHWWSQWHFLVYVLSEFVDYGKYWSPSSSCVVGGRGSSSRRVHSWKENPICPVTWLIHTTAPLESRMPRRL